MKRFLLILLGLLFGILPLQSQSILKYRYWFDDDVLGIRTGMLGDGNLLLDAEGLSDGLHMLYVMLEGDALMAPQRYMFVKVSPEIPTPAAELKYRYWYDDDVLGIRTGMLGDGNLLLDAEGLSDGLHMLYVMLEGDALMAPQRYMFVKVSPEIPTLAAELKYRYWFDDDVSGIRTGMLGDGNLLLDAEGLSDGLHMLYVMLEGDALMAPQRYMFVKVSPEIPTPAAELKYRYWYDDDVSGIRSGMLGDGNLILDAEGLSDGLHMLYVMLEGDALMSPQRYMFVKVSPEIPTPAAELKYRYWYDDDVSGIRTGMLGDGNLLLDSEGLDIGDHTLHIMLERECIMMPQSYDFSISDTITPFYAIIGTVNPVDGGIVSGSGNYSYGDTCALTAVPNLNYSFVNWTDNDEVVSNYMVYSFSVENSAIITANFIEDFSCEDYFKEEDTIVCDVDSFFWHGNTYTESGVYYDLLQTIHGCDSIYALSLEFFNTPLGEFTYMSPTNNYPFTSLPITFTWDAVEGSDHYDLYVWDEDEQMPNEPIKSRLYNRSYVVNSLPNYQSYKWCVVANNHCHINISDVRNFTLDIPPSINVNINALYFGETALNSENTSSLYVGATALNDSISIQLTGEDANMFSFVKDNAWNSWNGGMIYVTFNPTLVKYNFNATLEITSGDITKTVSLSGSIGDVFMFNTYVTQDVYHMNSTIPIFGSVTYNNDIPIAAADVEVRVNVMGTTRSLYATTDENGQFEVDFIPANSESGYYTINSGKVGHNSAAVHDDFNILGMSLVTSDYILWDVTQNQETTGSIIIKNRSQLPLTNITVTAISQPEGCSFTFQPLSLAGMEEGVLEYSVSGTTPTNGYQEVNLEATSSEGASLNFTVWYHCAEPRGILYASPNNITTTMTKGINKIVDVMLYNNGTGPTGSVYLDLPSEDWLSVVGNDTLPSIAVHDSAYFSLRLSANENTPLVQYTGNIAVNCERGDGLSLPYTIMAVSDSTGTLIVDVTDDYTYNGNGQHLAGATVMVKGYYSLETVALGLTGGDGLFTVSDIPEGYYRMSITAPHHAEYQAVILIEGGQTNTQDIYLQYQAITYSWNVVPTEIQDEYTFELIVEYETNVPVPVVVIDMPQNFPDLEPGESFVFDYIITNLGLVDAYDATLYPPTGHPLYDFTALITEIDTLHAQTTIVVPCTMTVRTRERSQAVLEALGGEGSREENECPYSALTKTKQYYMCGGKQNWFWANAWRNIGSTPCQSAPTTVTSGGGGPGGGGGGYGGGGGSSSSSSSTPAVTVQNNDCDHDPCLSGVKDDIDNCSNNGGGTPPNLPPQNPANNR